MKNNIEISILSAIVVITCSIKFFLDGDTLFGISFGHMDPTAYIAILTPVLTAHGYIKGKEKHDEKRL